DAETPEPGKAETEAQELTEAAPEELELTIEQSRALALEGNLDLKVELLNPTIAAQSITEAEAEFEALLLVDASHTKTDTPAVSGGSGTQSENTQITPGVSIPLRTGGTIGLEAPFDRLETNSSSNSTYGSDFSVSISQPFLRGGGLRSNTHAIRIARWETQKTETRSKLEVIRILSLVDRVYWRLGAARLALEVRKKDYDLAKTKLEQVRRQVEAGVQSEVEIVRSELGVDERLEAIIVAENRVREFQRDLKRIIQKPDLGMETPTVLIPVSPPSTTLYRLDAERLTELALGNRMELLELELKLAQENSQIDFERNETLPLVSLGYKYNMNGLGRSWADSTDRVWDTDFEDHQISLQVEIPLGNQAARSRLREAMLARIQTLATRVQRETLIEQEVYDSIDELRANWQRILASRQNVVTAARVFRAEQRQFDLGLRTSTEVFEAQNSLAEAKLREILAMVDYQIAQVDLAEATGTILGATKVRWVPIVPQEILDE
ncbi:MAG: TolC family protein, partial [Planctomycetota bacterium]